MCEVCKKTICQPFCPNTTKRDGIARGVHCLRCGERLLMGEGYYRIHGFPYCESCLDSVDAAELVRICEIPKRIWLEQMGFEFAHVGEEGRFYGEK